ncbi:hypothetical protein Purlil1_239 [Purpureocillium lilacinum]|uniref:Uncharacterized protein n=1 Tax=Purpureocillium lilacinum TaxID=33203 RepID=A0ABR0CG98_PURLI|nr:hypothetical protein Purlil1_239 [Purpureocillium lilacinum]
MGRRPSAVRPYRAKSPERMMGPLSLDAPAVKVSVDVWYGNGIGQRIPHPASLEPWSPPGSSRRWGARAPCAILDHSLEPPGSRAGALLPGPGAALATLFPRRRRFPTVYSDGEPNNAAEPLVARSPGFACHAFTFWGGRTGGPGGLPCLPTERGEGTKGGQPKRKCTPDLQRTPGGPGWLFGVAETERLPQRAKGIMDGTTTTRAQTQSSQPPQSNHMALRLAPFNRNQNQKNNSLNHAPFVHIRPRAIIQ